MNTIQISDYGFVNNMGKIYKKNKHLFVLCAHVKVYEDDVTTWFYHISGVMLNC